MFNTDIDSLILIIYTIGLIEITSYDKYDNASFKHYELEINISSREFTIFRSVLEKLNDRNQELNMV